MHNDNAFYARPGMAAFGNTGMAGAATKARTGSSADACGDPCPPACPRCGGLQCLCRPRFFAGQLLTDDTLNQLSRYIVEKNKLHNRHLQGWGVACGLEVSCDPCNPQQVTVSTGYALAPCGDDIVVCNDQAVNICELIDACTPQRQPRCDPPYERAPQDCRGDNNRWVLAICYHERPSRGVTALLGAGDSSCKSPCRCGGSSGCLSCGGSGCGGGAACGCGGQGAPANCSTAGTAQTNYNSQPRKTRQLNCEPTQVCEGYRFVAYPAPKDTGLTPFPGLDFAGGSAGFLNRLMAWLFTNRARFGPLIERLLCCMASAQDLLQAWGKGQKIAGPQALQAYVQYAQAMVDFTNEFTVHNCAFVAKAARLYDSAIEFANRAGDGAQLTDAELAHVRSQMDQLDVTLMDIVSECLCSALLPPCPAPAQDNCVPLAVVTLRGNSCQVVDICNWQERKLLITWPSVSYWLSWLPWHCLRDAIARFCCGTGRNSVVQQMLGLVLGVSVLGAACGKTQAGQAGNAAGVGNANNGVGQPAAGQPVNHAIGQPAIAARVAAHVAGNPAVAEQAVQDDDFVMQLLEKFDRTRSGNAAAPAWVKLAARASDGSLLDDLASVGGAGGVADMQAQVTALIRTVQSQQVQLDALQKRAPGQPGFAAPVVKAVAKTPAVKVAVKASAKKVTKPSPRRPK